MKFSLINVTKEHEDGSVEGYWIQDCIGSIERAIGVAYGVHLANNSAIEIAIVPAINSTTPALNYYKDLKPLAL